MKRVMTIQDISCIGKCSLTVALPVISSVGIETSIVPTAVLSTHTQFNGFTFRDLTDDMLPIKDHWQKEGFSFEAIYTGYLGSEQQIDIVNEYFDTFGGGDTVIIMDPAMADNGKLYTGFDENFARSMAKLCSKADVILPNISEACLMLGKDYVGEEASVDTIKLLLKDLANLGAKISVITGVAVEEGKLGFVGYDRDKDSFFSYATDRVPYKSHGTGDVYASAFTGALVNGKDTYEALCIAADYTARSILSSYKDPDRVHYAVNFEYELPYYMNRVLSY